MSGRRANTIEAAENALAKGSDDHARVWQLAVADKDAQILALQTLCNTERQKWGSERKNYAELIAQYELKLEQSSARVSALQYECAEQQKRNTEAILAASAVKEPEAVEVDAPAEPAEPVRAPSKSSRK